jgi:hypothetical protein
MLHVFNGAIASLAEDLSYEFKVFSIQSSEFDGDVLNQMFYPCMMPVSTMPIHRRIIVQLALVTTACSPLECEHPTHQS